MKIHKAFIRLFSILAISTYCISATANAAEAEVKTRTSEYNLKDNLALKGYDPVAYFTENKAVKGKADFTDTYLGVKYQFKNAENLAKFKADPKKYEPQYGGWCAYGFAIDAGKIPVNPKRFKIIDGKLYLFYDTLLGPNTKKKWNKEDEAAEIAKANKNWKKITK